VISTSTQEKQVIRKTKPNQKTAIRQKTPELSKARVAIRRRTEIHPAEPAVRAPAAVSGPLQPLAYAISDSPFDPIHLLRASLAGQLQSHLEKIEDLAVAGFVDQLHRAVTGPRRGFRPGRVVVHFSDNPGKTIPKRIVLESPDRVWQAERVGPAFVTGKADSFRALSVAATDAGIIVVDMPVTPNDESGGATSPAGPGTRFDRFVITISVPRGVDRAIFPGVAVPVCPVIARDLASVVLLDAHGNGRAMRWCFARGSVVVPPTAVQSGSDGQFSVEFRLSRAIDTVDLAHIGCPRVNVALASVRPRPGIQEDQLWSPDMGTKLTSATIDAPGPASLIAVLRPARAAESTGDWRLRAVAKSRSPLEDFLRQDYVDCIASQLPWVRVLDVADCSFTDGTGFEGVAITVTGIGNSTSLRESLDRATEAAIAVERLFARQGRHTGIRVVAGPPNVMVCQRPAPDDLLWPYRSMLLPGRSQTELLLAVRNGVQYPLFELRDGIFTAVASSTGVA
jgi:hypothetical protein